MARSKSPLAWYAEPRSWSSGRRASGDRRLLGLLSRRAKLGCLRHSGKGRLYSQSPLQVCHHRRGQALFGIWINDRHPHVAPQRQAGGLQRRDNRIDGAAVAAGNAQGDCLRKRSPSSGRSSLPSRERPRPSKTRTAHATQTRATQAIQIKREARSRGIQME